MSYSAARIHAMRSEEIDARTYRQLLTLQGEQMLALLHETEYRNDINALPLHELDDVSGIDRILAHNSDRTFAKLERISRKGFADALRSYIRRNDVWNLRVILDAIVGGGDTRDALVRYGRRGSIALTPFLDAKDIQTFVVALRKTFPIVRAQMTTAAEVSLLLRQLRQERVQGAAAKAASAILTDHENITSILALQRDGVRGSDARRCLLAGGTISVGTLRAAADAQSVEDAIRSLAATPYGPVLHPPADGIFIQVEQEIWAITLRRLGKAAGITPNRADILVRYLTEKEREHENLRLLFKAKRLGLDEEFIRRRLEPPRGDA
jgi:vacuolar-type H+-ATPase subunit C/Vma6